ncbi:hypothetical protein RF11_10061 [Thelohanellus kitauei]|uniref:Uncharacterized protein n=1 Tax=Thelohanellus kitauei TaxID=669202 RepID=A0A0C2J983_THEKT|nr:hypothetical protein RF11_10061 [Thelohanellus kitauei]
MMVHSLPVFILIIFLLGVSHISSTTVSPILTGDSAIKAIQCFITNGLTFCHGSLEREKLCACVLSSHHAVSEVSDPHLKAIFNFFEEKRVSLHSWYKEVAAEVSRRLNDKLFIVNELYFDWNEIVTSIHRRRTLIDHQFFFVYCSLNAISGPLYHTIGTFEVPIELQEDPLLKLINKAESNPSEILRTITLPGEKPSLPLGEIAFYVFILFIVFVLISLSLTLTIYSIYFGDNRRYSVIKM